MQEEKFKKGNNKVLLISIIAVIAVLFLSASVYLVLRAKRDGSQFKEEVKGEVVIPDKNESYYNITLDENGNLRYFNSVMVFDDERECYTLDRGYVEGETPEANVLELK